MADKSIADLQHQSFKEVGTKVARQVISLDEAGNPISSEYAEGDVVAVPKGRSIFGKTWDNILKALRVNGYGRLETVLYDSADVELGTELRNISGAKAMRYDDAGVGVAYQGWAEPGTATSAASWRIRKIVTSGEDVTITWCDGNTTADNKWDDRATLTYS